MRKWFFFFITMAALIGLAALGSAWSQSFFGAGETKKEQPKPGNSQVMSPETFKNQVNTLSRQTQDNLLKDAKQQLKQTPSLSAPTPPNEMPKATEQKSPVTSSEPLFGPEPSSEKATAKTDTTEVNAATPSANRYNPPITSSPTPSSSSGSSVYTGFGSEKNQQNQTTPSPSNSKNGGWNIKY